MPDFQQILSQAKSAKSKEEIQSVVEDLSKLIFENKKNAELLHSRAQLFIKLQLYGKAINDYRAILLINDKDKFAAGQYDMLSTIMQFNGNDIYANTNTNLDPWLD